MALSTESVLIAMHFTKEQNITNVSITLVYDCVNYTQHFQLYIYHIAMAFIALITFFHLIKVL